MLKCEEALLSMRDVRFGYRSAGEAAVDGVNLEIRLGECVGVVGHTGSGKSTLVQLMCGLLWADSGEIVLDGLKLAAKKRPKPREICRRVGIVFQYAEEQLFCETVAAEIGYALQNMGKSDIETKAAVAAIAEQLGIVDLLAQNPYELSGGEMRKVALAAVLVMEPKLLILDEPFVGLDTRARAELLALLKRWQKKCGAAIVCVSHDIEHLVKLCGRLLVMNSGHLVLDEEIATAFDKTELLAAAGVYPPLGRQAVRALDMESATLTVEEAARAIKTEFWHQA